MNKHRVLVRKINKMRRWKLGAEGTQYKKGLFEGKHGRKRCYVYEPKSVYNVYPLRCVI